MKERCEPTKVIDIHTKKRVATSKRMRPDHAYPQEAPREGSYLVPKHLDGDIEKPEEQGVWAIARLKGELYPQVPPQMTRNEREHKQRELARLEREIEENGEPRQKSLLELINAAIIPPVLGGILYEGWSQEKLLEIRLMDERLTDRELAEQVRWKKEEFRRIDNLLRPPTLTDVDPSNKFLLSHKKRG